MFLTWRSWRPNMAGCASSSALTCLAASTTSPNSSLISRSWISSGTYPPTRNLPTLDSGHSIERTETCPRMRSLSFDATSSARSAPLNHTRRMPTATAHTARNTAVPTIGKRRRRRPGFSLRDTVLRTINLARGLAKGLQAA